MAAPVVVEGLPPSPEIRSALLASCSEAVKQGSCFAEDAASEGDSTSVLAIVSWPDGDLLHVRVELDRDRNPNSPLTAGRNARDIRFADADPIVERWRAAGLLIAALVGESDRATPSSVPLVEHAEVPSKGTDTAVPSHAPAWQMDTRDRATWVGISALLGRGLTDGTLRTGASADVGTAIVDLPLFLSASVGYAVRAENSDGLHVRWVTLGAGGGARARLPGIRMDLRLRGELLFENVGASMNNIAVRAQDATERWSPGVRGAVEASWPSEGRIGVVAGFQAWTLAGGTALRLDQQNLSSSPWFGYSATLGAQFSWP